MFDYIHTQPIHNLSSKHFATLSDDLDVCKHLKKDYSSHKPVSVMAKPIPVFHDGHIRLARVYLITCKGDTTIFVSDYDEALNLFRPI